MTQQFNIAGLNCLCATVARRDRIAYILYPMDCLSAWIAPAATKYDTNIVVITGMDWQNVFSPWPAKGVPAGTPDFKGESPQFLKTLIEQIVPYIEVKLKISTGMERTLVGVSMSGLFSLWQWPQTDTFRNIASLSGSFWYEGFIDWFKRQNFSNKTGEAYFLLGNLESKAKAFSTVGINTGEIVKTLRQDNINVRFQSVPGNHYADPIPRLNDAFIALYL